MERRTINRDESSLLGDENIVTNAMKLEEKARNYGAGCCGMIGHDGGENSIADTVNSATLITNETNGIISTNMFLNQNAYDWNGRHRNNTTPKKPKRKSGADKSNDQPDLSSLIASELTKLSMEDRIKALEEVHGVVENIEEDPEEINKLFDQVKEELKRLRCKQAYEKAAFLSSAYVNDPEFVLPFLRADDYHPRPAAIRLAEHFKYKLELFGEHTLVRDIMYDDLNNDEKAILNSGIMQTLPASDRAGRQITVCNLSEFLKIGTLKNCIRAMWYLSVRNVQLNHAISNMGIVGVYFAHGMENIFDKLYNKNDLVDGTGFMQNALPFKFASVHFCFEDKFGSIGAAIQTNVMMSLGKCARIRLRSHCGSRMECTYALKSYGIDIDTFETDGPTSLSDSVQGVMQCYRDMDEGHQKKLDARLLPRPNDVLLGRGRPFQLYSGNLALTAKIDENRTRYMAAKKMHKKLITSEIVESIHKSGGRFLKKVSNGDQIDVDWEKVDFETSRLKVSHSFRTMSRWQNEDACNQGGTVSEETLVDSIPSISVQETNSLDFMTESNLSNDDPLATNINFGSSNKRRKG